MKYKKISIQVFKLLFLSVFSFAVFSLGVLFSKTGERYFGYFVDSIYRDSAQIDKTIRIPIRYIELSRDPEIYDDESDRMIIKDTLYINPQNIGLLLIDVWDATNEPNDGYRERTIRRTQGKIIPLLNKARNVGIKIFHSPNGSAITKEIQVLDNETNLSWLTPFPIKMQRMYFYWLAKSKGINTLLIAGYSTPLCVFERPIGVQALSRYEELQMILVRDATHTWEYSDFGKQTFTRTFIEYLEHKYLATTTVDAIAMIVK
jgi:hypothetical protein